MLYTDPPYMLEARQVAYEFEAACYSTPIAPETVKSYATRVGRETVASPVNAAEIARHACLAGLPHLIEATAVCAAIPIQLCGLVGPYPLYSVGGAAARALARARDSLELRTPPANWTNAPPLELFDP